MGPWRSPAVALASSPEPPEQAATTEAQVTARSAAGTRAEEKTAENAGNLVLVLM